MSRLRQVDLEQFVLDLESVPGQLGLWRAGRAELYPTLAWLNVHPIVERRNLAEKVGPAAAAALTVSADHNQCGIASGWAIKYLRGPDRGIAKPEQDLKALWRTAGRYWGLHNLLVEVRVGVRGFEPTGTRISMPYTGNGELDALDRILDLAEAAEATQSLPPRPHNPRVASWLQGPGQRCPWDSAPPWIQDAFRSLASDVLATYPKYLAGTVAVAGFTFAELDAYWIELMARGMHMNAAILWGSEHPPTVAPLFEPDALSSAVANDAGISPSSSERITALLTMDTSRCADPAITPLVPVEDRLLPMSSLIVPAAPHRNTLAIVQADPSLYGDAGRLLGLAGEKATLELFARLSDATLTASRLNVIRADGSTAGDLDVVLCDPVQRQVAIFEIKWHIAADGNAEVYKMEQAAIAKREQVKRLRHEIESGKATVRWPPGWHDTAGFELRWFVLTRDVLATQHVDDDLVTLRSHQLIRWALRDGATVGELIDLLDHPPKPPATLSHTRWVRVRFGDLRIDAEMIAGGPDGIAI